MSIGEIISYTIAALSLFTGFYINIRKDKREKAKNDQDVRKSKAEDERAAIELATMVKQLAVSELEGQIKISEAAKASAAESLARAKKAEETAAQLKSEVEEYRLSSKAATAAQERRITRVVEEIALLKTNLIAAVKLLREHNINIPFEFDENQIIGLEGDIDDLIFKIGKGGDG